MKAIFDPNCDVEKFLLKALTIGKEYDIRKIRNRRKNGLWITKCDYNVNIRIERSYFKTISEKRKLNIGKIINP